MAAKRPRWSLSVHPSLIWQVGGMEDLLQRVEAAITRAELSVTAGEPLPPVLDQLRELRRQCAQHGENQLAFRLWNVERELWAKLNPPRGGE